MNHSIWPTVRLGQLLVDLQPGFARDPGDGAEGVAQLRTNNVHTSGEIDTSSIKHVEASEKEIDRYSVQRGDVIFNNTNSPELVGKAALFDLDEPWVLSNHMTRLRARTDLIEPAFLARALHMLWQFGFSNRRAKQWVNQAAIDTSAVAAFPIPLPPLSEQRRIVRVLDEARAVRRLRRQADDLTHQLIPAIFHDMFGDPLSNDRDWPTEVLPKLGTLDRGRSRHRPRDEPSLYDGPYPFIQTGDVKNANGWITRYTQTYSEEGLAQSRMWPAGTMCITIAANIAATAIMTFDACFPDSIVGFTPNDRVTIEYVRWTFEVLQAKMEAQAHDGAQKNINLKILNALRLAVPPKPLQKEFSRRVHAIRDIGLSTTSRDADDPQADVVDPIDELTNSLLAHAFSGELTAEWREAHRDELTREAAERDAALKAAGVKLAKPARPTMGGDVPMTGRYAELNREQRELLKQVRQALEGETSGGGPAFTIQSMRDWLEEPLDDLPDDALRRHLEVMVTRGLMKLVSRPLGAASSRSSSSSSSSSESDGRSGYGNVYRLVREQAGEEEESELVRMSELSRMARTGRVFRESVSHRLKLSDSAHAEVDDNDSETGD